MTGGNAMPSIKLPYGKGFLTAEIPDERLLSVLEPEGFPEAPEDQRELIRRALESPIESPRLSELAGGKKNIVIIASDHTRPVPSKLIMPLLLEEIRKGSPDAEVTILVATGAHRSPAEDELIEKFGEDIYANERIIVHDCDDKANLVYLGKLPSGGELWINRLAAEAELLAAEGFIEPHFFAGFSGGRKSALPGIAGRETVAYNHNAEFIDSPYCRAGVLENNPIHADMVWAARAAGLKFILNVVLNSAKEVVCAVAGDCEKAHEKGAAFLLERRRVQGEPADIVIATNGGYPLDRNIYQAVKGMTSAEAVVRQGGVIVMLAQSLDGHGAEGFYDTFRGGEDLDGILASFMATPKERTRIDQWQSQIFIRVLKRARVVYVSDAPDEIVRGLRMVPAPSVGEAIGIADELLGDENGRITVIPDGVSVIVSR